MTDNKIYSLDKTKAQKIGKTTFIVSSFFKTNNTITFLSILKKLVETEMSA